MKKLCLIWILLLVLPLVVAAPPLQENVQTSGLTIIYPQNEYMKFGEDIDLYFHVYNSSNVEMTNATSNCSIHIYNHSDNLHLVQQSLTWASTDREWEYVLNMTLFNQTGVYPYLVYCEQTTGGSEKGYVSNFFRLTTTGEDIPYQAFILAAIFIFIPLIFAWLILYWITSLGLDHATFKIWMSIFALLNVLLSLWFAVLGVIKFLEWNEMQDALTTAVWIYGIMFFVIFSYFFIYLIAKAMQNMGRAKMEKLQY